MKKIISISGLLGLIVFFCWVQPTFAQDDLESLHKEFAEQKKLLVEQMRKLEALEKRLKRCRKQCCTAGR